MNQTRDKILKISLNLFNQHGIDDVSMRDITSKLKISVGNLNYYFPSKNDIVHALCIELIDRLNQLVLEILKSHTGNILEMLFAQLKAIFTAQLEYRFIFNKRYGEIITSLPSVQKYYQEVLKDRFDEWFSLHPLLVKQKLAKPALIENNISVIYTFNILAVFWHQEIEIYYPDFTDKQKIDHALSIFFNIYKPYLTKKGQEELLPLLKKLERY